jgi:hypothetical protein
MTARFPGINEVGAVIDRAYSRLLLRLCPPEDLGIGFFHAMERVVDDRNSSFFHQSRDEGDRVGVIDRR